MQIIALAVLAGTLTSGALAADLTGEWQAEFDTQIGRQKYRFEFKVEGGKVTGQAHSDIGGEKREAELQEGKLVGDQITFSEHFDFQGNSVRIAYDGQLANDQIKFTRKVGDFATEQLVARRASSTAGNGVASATNPPARRVNPPPGVGLPPRVELGPDDKPAFPAAPAGFAVRRDNIPHGKIATLAYDSKTVGTNRQLVVYTPPGYSSDKKYPVLYLLRGMRGHQKARRPEPLWIMVARADEVSDRQSIENPFWFAAGVRAAQANVGTGTISHSLVTRLVTS